MATLTGKQRAFVDQYFICDFNATEAAARAGYAGDRDTLAEVGSQNLRNLKIRAAIEGRLAERTMSADEVLTRLADQGRGSLDDVLSFQVVPRPTRIRVPLASVIADVQALMAFEDAFAARAALSEAEQTSHLAHMASMRRRIIRLELTLERDPDATEEAPGPPVDEYVPVLDLDKARQNGKLQLIKSFNAKDGKVELYSAQSALDLLGKHHGLFTEKIELSGPDGGPVEVALTPYERHRRITQLLDAGRARGAGQPAADGAAGAGDDGRSDGGQS